MGLLSLLIVTVASGAAGGFASYLLQGPVQELVQEPASPPDPPPPSAADTARAAASVASHKLVVLEGAPWLTNVFLGIIAAFIVPLFLSLAQSKLIESILGTEQAASNGSTLIYMGFCLVASVSFRSFVSGVSGQVLSSLQSQVDANARGVSEAKQKIDVLEENVENPAAVADEANSPDEVRSMGTSGDTAVKTLDDLANLPPVSANELKVLAAISDSRFDRRTIPGIARDSEMARRDVLVALSRLSRKGLVRDRLSKRTDNVLYELTPHGMAASKVSAATDGRAEQTVSPQLS